MKLIITRINVSLFVLQNRWNILFRLNVSLN